MLKKENRLSKFNKIENLKSITTPYFILKYQKGDVGIAKFGFIVSKKIDKRATVRNKVRRKLQEIVRENIESVLPYTYLIISKEKSIEESRGNLSKIFKTILIKNNLQK